MPKRDMAKLVEEALAIEAQEAQEAGALAYMARLFCQTSLPYRDPGEVPVWGRSNGIVSLTMQPGYRQDKDGRLSPIGFPYGVIPRLLLAWLTTEAVQTKSRTLFLSDSLSAFLAELGLASTGGTRGNIGRVRTQLERLFRAHITCEIDSDEATAAAMFGVADGYCLWWDPKQRDPRQGQLLPSSVTLSEAFYEQVLSAVPVDLRALRALKGAPLRLDIYAWLVHRLSYLRRPTAIPWELLRFQFGSAFADTRFGRARFREDFTKHLRQVLVVYRAANVEVTPPGLVLRPSRTHIAPRRRGTGLLPY
jgi:hypothetical protein